MKNPSERLRLLTALALASALAAGALASHADARRQTPAAPPQAGLPARDPHPLDALDRAVQKRFHQVVGFGMARIATEKKFEPTTEEERAAVGALKRDGYRVALYLAGRAVLADAPAEARAAKKHFGIGPGVPGMSGPIFVSSPGVKGLPGGAVLWDETRRALESFAAGGERYGFSAGPWEVEARAVRAGGESCLKCHSPDVRVEYLPAPDGRLFTRFERKGAELKVGDPLGVLLYAYRRAR
ncbi:MAG TPA: hypothetical protein VF659_16800 [Pyrinomonadaceae bacterium]|jgi:hypothetical protein